MAETKDPGQKTLEMRVAELEDKLSQLHISEEELKTYQKVAAKLGTSACQQCTASPCIAAQAQQPCIASQQPAGSQISPFLCYYYHCYYHHPCYVVACIRALCSQTDPASRGGGGFGGFGM